MTFLSIVVGLIIAGQLSPFLADRKARQDQRENIVRVMLRTMPMPAHPDFQAALSQIKFDFRKYPSVISALNSYLDACDEPDTTQDLQAKTAELISELFSAIGQSVEPAEILAGRYLSRGFYEREETAITAQRAWPRIADALESNNELLRKALNQNGPDEAKPK